ncbi:MAG TPA: PKD domain-containing protein, partial [Bacteroidia bacterium]|nr:PKD domain-containing protein [Bacteroidia bacterium]
NPTQFTNLTSGGSAANTYNWTFQGGGTSTATNPQYTFPSAGTFTVTLQALNGGCGGDTTLSVVVNSPPIAGFTAPTVCQNSPTGFTNTSTNVTAGTPYKWIFGDGTTSNAASPSHTYAACGTYNVILVAGVAPCIDSAKSTVTVNPNPKPAFTANPVCLGNNTIFTDTTKVTCGGSEATWSWMFGDPGSGANNTSASQDPTHIFADTGCYSVFFKITTNLGCADSTTRPVCITGPPVPKFTATTVCVGKTTVFTNLSAPKPANSKWYFGDPLNSTSTLANPSFTYPAAGTYTVKLIVSSGAGCIDSITAPVTVNPLPTSGFTADTVCQGIATAFKDTSHGGAAYSWNFGDGKGTSTAQNPTYTYAAAGTYKVSELVVTAAGCRDSITLSVLVNPNPTATITVPPVCLGTASVFTLTPTNMTGGTYAWTMGDGKGTSTAQNPTYTYAANGAYTASVNLTSVNGCLGTATVVAIVNPIPVPNFTAPPVCLGKATSFNGNPSTLANV